MSILRRQDWRSKLQAWAHSVNEQPFAWGSTDCGALARAAIIEMFGEHVAPLLPEWNNGQGAALILQVRGSFGAILEDLGAERTSVPFMRAGDILISAEPEEKIGGESAMVCIDGQVCLASTSNGVIFTTPSEGATVYSLWEIPFNG